MGAIHYSARTWAETDKPESVHDLIMFGYKAPKARKWINDVNAVSALAEEGGEKVGVRREVGGR